MPIEERVEDLLGYMTLEEKIGQMALVEKKSLWNARDVANYGLGAVLSGSGGNPKDNTPTGWKQLVTQFTDEALKTRLAIPLLYGADANHGNGNLPGATLFPHAIGLGAANDSALTERIARATAEESRAMGVRWNFSPVLELPRDIRWGRVYEAFSDDVDRVGTLGASYVRGLQDAPEREDVIDVLATPKHYIGLGSLVWGTARNTNYRIDQGAIPADEELLRDASLPPYQAAIDAGAMSIMAGIGTWGDEHIVANRYLLTDVLKNELEFEGFVVSDWYGVYNIARSKYESTVAGINAGVDMVMLPFDYKPFVSDMQRAVGSGDISEQRVDDAVRRILRAKFAMGLFDDDASIESGFDEIGSSKHRALAREAVQRSLVLLKNEGRVLPLDRNARKIRVAGNAADNVGRQAGGWTVEWQGIDGNWLPGATSILAGIRDAAGKGTTIEYDREGNFSTKDLAEVGIAIVGEKPYSEGVGDNAYPRLDDEDIAAIENLRRTSDKVVVILVTGRPLIITD
ncbi:MAG: glycoside hydrolase family 3 protein, partial [Candidatus Uhrbacteria bacterium]|nr:glycoside hydrolase family 3 protein [Candidatus Uhrbacteria bacterium]